MKIIRDPSAFPAELRCGAVAIGNFDGVHLGHARIISRLIAKAREVGGPAVVFTFDPHPALLLRPTEAPPPLTWTERKAELLAQLGVDLMLVYPTDEALLQLSPRDFYDRIVRGLLDAQALVEGPNFFFGHDRAGTIELLDEYVTADGLTLEIVEPYLLDDQIVSSSRIRKSIATGQVEQAGRMLTQPYRIRGLVTHGAGRGAKLGFATANVEAVDTLLPAPGVYAGRALTGGKLWPAAINLGPNPTFHEQSLKVEVHLIGFSGALYGEPLEVDFLFRLRDIQTFDSVEALKRQVTHDVAEAQRLTE